MFSSAVKSKFPLDLIHFNNLTGTHFLLTKPWFLGWAKSFWLTNNWGLFPQSLTALKALTRLLIELSAFSGGKK
jgi:hypothetical protein